LTEAIGAAEGARDAPTVAADGDDVLNNAKWVSTADKNAFDTAINNATAAKDNTSASNEQLTDALTDLATASTAFTAAQKPGYKFISGGGLTITPIYRGFQVELTSGSGVFLLCDDAPVCTDIYSNIKYIFQGPKFDSGSHVFTLKDWDGNSQGTPLTVYAVDVTGGIGTNDTHLYHTNIDTVNFAFNGPAWQLTRAAAPVRNSTTLLPDAGLSAANSRIYSYRYNTSGTYSQSNGDDLTWMSNAINIWSWLYGEETAFSYRIEYQHSNGRYIVYAGNVEHQSYPEVPLIYAYGTIALDISGSYSYARLGLFKDDLCTQTIDSSGYAYSDGTWSVRALRSDPDLAPGKTVYYGVILYDSSGGSKIIPVPGKSGVIEAGTYYYPDIPLGTVTGSYP
jgi:hypothetical protein